MKLAMDSSIIGDGVMLTNSDLGLESFTATGIEVRHAAQKEGSTNFPDHIVFMTDPLYGGIRMMRVYADEKNNIKYQVFNLDLKSQFQSEFGSAGHVIFNSVAIFDYKFVPEQTLINAGLVVGAANFHAHLLNFTINYASGKYTWPTLLTFARYGDYWHEPIIKVTDKNVVLYGVMNGTTDSQSYIFLYDFPSKLPSANKTNLIPISAAHPTWKPRALEMTLFPDGTSRLWTPLTTITFDEFAIHNYPAIVVSNSSIKTTAFTLVAINDYGSQSIKIEFEGAGVGSSTLLIILLVLAAIVFIGIGIFVLTRKGRDKRDEKEDSLVLNP